MNTAGNMKITTKTQSIKLFIKSICATLVLASSPLLGEELIKDGKVSSADAVPECLALWKNNGDAELLADSKIFASPPASAHLKINKDGFDGNVSARFKLTPGASLKVSGKVRTSNSGGFVALQLFDSNNKSIDWKRLAALEAGNEFVPFELITTVPDRAGSAQIYATAKSGDIWLDDLSAIIETPIANITKSVNEMQKLPEGNQMLPENAASSAALIGNKGVMEKVSIEGRSFKEALRITIKEKCNTPWDVQIVIPSVLKLSKGDSVIVRMWARTLSAENETGEAYLSGGAQRDKEPHEKPVWFSFSVPREWQLIEFSGISNLDIPANQVKFFMHIGQNLQSFEIAGFQMLNLGQNVPKKLLPVLKLTYDGRKPDAPWRQLAEESIEKIRKGNLSVRVTDADGNPVEGADVQIKMQKHAFPFGTCVNAAYLSGDMDKNNPNVKQYREEFLKLFNSAVIENHLKAPMWEDPKNRVCAMNALKWLKANDILIRGHTAVWPGERYFARSWNRIIGYKANSPSKTREELLASVSEENRQKLYDAVNSHVTDIFTATKGYCFQWDVMNEPYANHTLMDIYGDHVMVDWFKAAKLADPSTRLCINDYGIVIDEKHAEHYMKTIKYLLDNGAPLEGIGEQGHYGQQPPSISSVIKAYDMLGRFGLPVICTEFDIDSPDEDIKADFLRDYMTALFSNSSCGGFMLWGFWEGAHWKPDAAMISKDWKQKPGYKAYCDLVLKKWWTNTAGKTGRNGLYEIRGFLGDYEVTASHDGKTKTEKLKLPKDGIEIKIKLD